MSLSKIKKDLDYYNVSIIRNEFFLDIDSYQLEENDLIELENYLLENIKRKHFSSLRVARQRVFPKIKNYLEEMIKVEESYSLLYAYYFTLYKYDGDIKRFLNFLHFLTDNNQVQTIKFHAYEIAQIPNNIGLDFLREMSIKLDDKELIKIIKDILKMNSNK